MFSATCMCNNITYKVATQYFSNLSTVVFTDVIIYYNECIMYGRHSSESAMLQVQVVAIICKTTQFLSLYTKVYLKICTSGIP